MANTLVGGSRRTIYHLPRTNCIVPTDVDDAVNYLDKQRPEFTCLYFHANWNPMCEQIEEDYHKFAARNAAWTHIKVDCDATPKVKLFFDARVEPQFLMLLNGMEVRRQIGFNFSLMDDHLEDVLTFHKSDNAYFGDSGKQWERFYDSFDRWSKDGQADRDALKMKLDDQVDQWRGPGTLNP